MKEALFMAERVVYDEIALNMKLRRFIYRMEPPVVGNDGVTYEWCCVTTYRFHTDDGPKWKGNLFPADQDWQIVRGGSRLVCIVEDDEVVPERVLGSVGYSADRNPLEVS